MTAGASRATSSRPRTPILFFVDHARELGGAEISLLLTIEAVDRQRFVPHLVTRAGRLYEAARGGGVAVHDVPLRRLKRTPASPWNLIRGGTRLARAIRQESAQLVVSATMRGSIYAALAAKLTGCPFVWGVHDVFPRGPYVRWLSRLSQATIAVSEAAARSLPGDANVHIIPNGVGLDSFLRDHRSEAATLRGEWGVPADAVLIGQVARLVPWKGQRDVIAAAERLRDVPNLYVIIVGGNLFGNANAYVNELKGLVRERGLADRVIFGGHREHIPATLQALDLVVHASHDEPFGRILVEAGAAGLPVVAYESGAVPEILRHERTALLVPPGNTIELAAACRLLACNRDLARRLGEQARSEVRRRFEIGQVTRAREGVFESVLRAEYGRGG